MNQRLSQQDIAALLRDVTAPENAAARLSGTVATGMLSPAERQAAEQVLRGMLNGAAVTIRHIIADTLKGSPHLPHDVAMAFANDVDSVSIPVLQFSSVLTDEDLLAVIRSGAPGKQVAVAGRATVSTEVAGELLKTDNATAAVKLVANPGAALDASLLETAATKFGSDRRMTASLQKRPDLPISIAERLVAFTAETLRAYIARRTDLPESVITQLVLQMREQVTVDLRSPHFPAEEAGTLVEHLHAVKRLTSSLILRAACVGDLSFVEAAMTQLAGIAIHNVRLLMYDAGHLGFNSLYDKTKLPQSYLPAFKVAVEVAKETEMDGLAYDRERYRRQMIERILTQFEALGAEDLDYLLIRLDDPTPIPSPSAQVR
ncbi:MAG: hypothetical protein QOJ54_673 [Aliidongia sp.]|jgi:uncharacterized protein (DUF2336 family)|nr:hypothetical protein [Aliidongia sp.]